MNVTVDSAGRLLLPKKMRDALGMTPGSTVEVSPYGAGLQVTPGGRTARLERAEDGRLVSRGDEPITDEEMFALIDAGRR